MMNEGGAVKISHMLFKDFTQARPFFNGALQAQQAAVPPPRSYCEHMRGPSARGHSLLMGLRGPFTCSAPFR